jgi:hypothetical protein
VTSCVVGAAFHGTYSVLVDEWREGAENIGSEIERLLGILKDHQHETSTVDENPYLAHTGLVWAAIDRMKGLSRTENEAVIKRWEGQKEIVKDAWTEFKEFLEDQEGDDDEDEDDFGDEGEDEDDEWGVLERGMAGGKMSAEEKSRAEAVSYMIRFFLQADNPGKITAGLTSIATCLYTSFSTLSGDINQGDNIPRPCRRIWSNCRCFRYRHLDNVPRAG